MKRYQIIFLALFLNVISLFAQGNKGTVHLEITDSKNVKKELEAKCFVLTVLKANSTFAVILFDKSFVADTAEVKVYLTQQQKTDPAIITIPVNAENVVQSGKLAGIPYLNVRQQTQNLLVVKPTFFPDDLIVQTMKGVTEKDLEDFTVAMEKWAGY